MYAKKSLGQHFLRCNWVVQTLVKAAEVGPQDIVLEIGPGTGVLTRELARRAKKVIAVEKDEGLIKELKKSLKNEGINNVAMVSGDILKKLTPNRVWFNNLTQTRLGAAGSCGPSSKLLPNSYKLIANIPYYLTSRLLRLLLEKEPRPKIIVLTIQKEVAERICAKPPQMNLLALSVQAYGKPEIIKKVPASCFYPKPGVDSAIIKISDISDRFFTGFPEVGLPAGSPPSQRKIDQKEFFKIIRLAFSQKRKTLAHTLGKPFGRKAVEKALKKLKQPLTARPEELSPEEWTALISWLG